MDKYHHSSVETIRRTYTDTVWLHEWLEIDQSNYSRIGWECMFVLIRRNYLRDGHNSHALDKTSKALVRVEAHSISINIQVDYNPSFHQLANDRVDR